MLTSCHIRCDAAPLVFEAASSDEEYESGVEIRIPPGPGSQKAFAPVVAVHPATGQGRLPRSAHRSMLHRRTRKFQYFVGEESSTQGSRSRRDQRKSKTRTNAVNDRLAAHQICSWKTLTIPAPTNTPIENLSAKIAAEVRADLEGSLLSEADISFSLDLLKYKHEVIGSPA